MTNEPTILTISAGTMRPEDTLPELVYTIGNVLGDVDPATLEAEALLADWERAEEFSDERYDIGAEIWERFENLAGVVLTNRHGLYIGRPVLYAGTCPHSPDEILLVIGTHDDDSQWWDDWYC
jgi:hypothetical protein